MSMERSEQNRESAEVRRENKRRERQWGKIRTKRKMKTLKRVEEVNEQNTRGKNPNWQNKLDKTSTQMK